MAALLHEDSPAEVDRVGRELRCSNVQIDEATWLVGTHDGIEQVGMLSLAAFKKLLAHPRFDELLALHEACCRAFNQQAECVAVARQRRDSIAPAMLPPTAGDR